MIKIVLLTVDSSETTNEMFRIEKVPKLKRSWATEASLKVKKKAKIKEKASQKTQ